MCSDYTYLNKACPKDAYPFPNIGRFADRASEFQVLSFLDEEKTTFITKDAIFCYKVMPFGLKNTGATYQLLMDRVFKQQID